MLNFVGGLNHADNRTRSMCGTPVSTDTKKMEQLAAVEKTITERLDCP